MWKGIFRNFFSRPLFQPFFELCLSVSLKGMNVGDGHSPKTSGEENVFLFLKNNAVLNTATIFDVGAHTGEWLELLREHSSQAKVYCFEPSETSFQVLSKKADPQTTCVQQALGIHEGTAELTAETSGDSQSHITASSENTTTVSMTTVDAFCKKHNIQKIDLLKMDVEGYELNVLRGAREMLQKGAIERIQFEFGSLSEEQPSLKAFFDMLGDQFVLYRILKKGLRPIKTYRHYFEIHTTTNFLAVKKGF